MSRLILLFIAYVAAMFLCVEAGKKTHVLKAKINAKPAPMIFMKDIHEENKKKTNKVSDKKVESTTLNVIHKENKKETIKVSGKKVENTKVAKVIAPKDPKKNELILNEPYAYVVSSTPKKVENKSRTHGEWPKTTIQPKTRILPVSPSPVVISSFPVSTSPYLFIWAFIISLVAVVISFMKDDLSEHFRGMKSIVYKKAFLKDLRPKNFHPVISEETSPTHQEPDRTTFSELLPSLSSVPQIDLTSIGLPSMISNKPATVPQKLLTYAVPPETPDQSVSGKETLKTESPSSLKKGKEVKKDTQKPSPGSITGSPVATGNKKIDTQKPSPGSPTGSPVASGNRKMGVFFSSPFSVQANSKRRSNSYGSNDGTLEVEGDEVNVIETHKSGQSNSAVTVAVMPNGSPAATVTAATTDFLYAIGNGMQTTANVVASAATAGVPTNPPPKPSSLNNNTNTTDNAAMTTSINKFFDPVVFSDKKETGKPASKSSNRIPFTTTTTTATNINSNGSNQPPSTSSSRSINSNSTNDSNGSGYSSPDLRDLVSDGSPMKHGASPAGEAEGGDTGNGQGQRGYGRGRGRRYFDIRNYQDASNNDHSADREVDDATDKPKDEPTVMNLWHVLY